jgi:CubicO group peptidase (beta-lactamase class C family)
MSCRGVGVPLQAAALLFALSAAAHAQSVDARLPLVGKYFDALQAKSEFSGVVLIAHGDVPIFEEAYGYADVELRVPMQTNDIFRIGSLTKPVTASAALIAIDRGRLRLDAEICTLLPACLPTWRSVRVRDLLTHTSGIPDHFGDLKAVPVEQTAAEFARMVGTLDKNEPLKSPPGQTYAYSNFNYVLLGLVLESALKTPWAEVLKEELFDPLHLSSFAYDDVYAIVPGRVRGYDHDKSGALKNIDYKDHAAYAAGGLRATIDDLFKWSRAEVTGELFEGRLLRDTFTPYKGNYGLGWQIVERFGLKMYNHTGGIDGFSTHIAYFPQRDLTIVVFGNIESDSAHLRACDVESLLFHPQINDVNFWRTQTADQRCGIAD